MAARCTAQSAQLKKQATGTTMGMQCIMHRCQQLEAKQPACPIMSCLVMQLTSFSFRPKRGLGPSCSSQHSGAKGTSPPATPPNMSKPASTATMTGPARVPGSLPLLFCKQILPLRTALAKKCLTKRKLHQKLLVVKRTMTGTRIAS